MKRVMKVTGKGSISVKPDMIRLRITAEAKRDEYEAAVKESSVQKGELTAILEKLGFEKTSLKTLHFSVDPVYEYIESKNRNVLTGYRFLHQMKLEFPSDPDVLGRVLYAFAHSDANPEFSIEYTTSDPESAKNLLLSKAVADSREKAGVLAAAAAVSLGQILSINYSWDEIDLVSTPMSRNSMKCYAECADEAYGMAIEPDDIRVSDTVTVIWEIE